MELPLTQMETASKMSRFGYRGRQSQSMDDPPELSWRKVRRAASVMDCLRKLLILMFNLILNMKG
jgi:hypothetical protein